MIDNGCDRTSVCEVINDDNGQKWLDRLADIDAKKHELVKFYFNADLPWYFDNRNRLYLNDGPDAVGSIGAWHWTAKPRDTDSTKDYITSEYEPELSPVEIIVLKDITTLEELVCKFKEGIITTSTGINSIYCIKTGKNEYKGFLYKDSYFCISGNKKILKPEVNSLPLIELTRDDMCNTERHTFLRSLILPNSNEDVLIKSPMEIVKEIVMKRCSWSTMKAAGLSKNEFKHLRDYIKEVPNENLFLEISDACNCSMAEARAFVDELLNNITRYFSQEDAEFQIVDQVIESHEALNNKYYKLIQQQWEKQNADKLEIEKERLDAVTKQVEDCQVKLKDLTAEIKSKEEIRDELHHQIDADQHFADEVKANVEKKINEAKENAAAFIAEMAFSQPVMDQGLAQKSDVLSSKASVAIITGKTISNEEAEKIDNLKDCAGILADELQEAGVSEEHRAFLASFLMAAWEEKTPLLIAGPNADRIADALSATLDSKMADRIQCLGSYSKIQANSNDKIHGVTVVENVFSNDWIDHIQYLMPDNNRYYIFTNPFAEDLMIEPRGLYNYMIPFFTEPFIDHAATCDFYGGILTAQYSVPQPGTNSSIKIYEQYLKNIGCSSYFLANVCRIIRALSSYPGHKADWDYYVMLAYSILTGSKDSMLEQLNHDSRVSNDCKNLVGQLLGANR